MSATPAKSQPEAPSIPVVLTGQALNSLRDSGYSLPAGVAELVDNSIEARANTINLLLQPSPDSKRKHVHRIVAIDDGEGMDVGLLRRCLQVGFSTRYMRKDTIGKYGVGAKLAALNFGKRVDVWSRTTDKDPWLNVYFDLSQAMEEEIKTGRSAGIEEPRPRPLPDDLVALAPSGSGTVVVWSDVDRLEDGRFAPDFNGLVADLMEELSRIFREFIDGGIKLTVNGKELLAHDPLFLMRGTWSDSVLAKIKPDKEGRKESATHFPAKVVADEVISVKGAKARLRITLYPQEVTRTRGAGGDTLAKQLRVPQNEGVISFVRLKREIAYNNVPRIFPRGVQEPDRFIGIEVAFEPDMDNLFGVRNVKRGVEPHGELRDKIREKLGKYLPEARKLLDERWGEVARENRAHDGEHAPIMQAVKGVDATMPKGKAPAVPEKQVQEELEKLAADAGQTKEEDKKEYIERVRGLPFVVESVDFPGKMFIDIKHLNNQVIIRVNTRHRFYRELWEPLHVMGQRDPGTVSGDDAVKTARRAVEGLALMVVAFGKAQSMSDNPSEYEDLTAYWGQFVDTLMGKVKNVI